MKGDFLWILAVVAGLSFLAFALGLLALAIYRS